MYIEFICTKATFPEFFDAAISEFDAFEHYELLTAFYDACPECESFPRDVYFPNGRDPNWTDYVILEDGKIAARAGIWKFSDAEWEVAGVITHPDYRGRGYSERIVRHCTAKILAHGKTAFCTTAETNTAMIATALKAGFQIRET